MAIKSDWAEGWWYLGTLFYDANRYSEAKSSFEKEVQLLPSMGSAWNFLGLCEFELKDYPAARQHLEKGHSFGATDDPEIDRISAYHLALLRIKDGDFQSASTLLVSAFPEPQTPEQIKLALGLALLRAPLLPSEVDPSKEALLRSAGEAAASAAKGNLPAELATLDALVKAHPETPYLHYAYGNALASANRNQEALQQQRVETTLSPNSELPWIAISSLELRSRSLESARNAAERATQLAPHSQAAHRAFAESLQAVGQVTQASEQSRLAESFAPATPQPEQRIADLYRIGAPTSATATPNDSTWKQAMLDYSGAKYAEAATGLKLWLQSKPEDGTAWAVLGLSEFEMKDYDNALIHLQRGHELGFGGSPEAVQLANYRLGMLLNHAGQFDRAMTVLASHTSAGSLNKDVQFALGMSLLRMEFFPNEVDVSLQPIVQTAGQTAELLHSSQYDQAFANFDSMLKQSPHLPFLHYAYGTALIALSRYDDAETQMREELQISPKSELPYVRLASIATRQHRAADAIKAAQQAVKLAPQSGEAHYLLGRACLESGDIETAVNELEAARSIAPNSPEIHFNLAKAYARAKLPEKADQERALFVRLNAEAEHQRSHTGNQSYEGPRQASDLDTNVGSAAPPR